MKKKKEPRFSRIYIRVPVKNGRATIASLRELLEGSHFSTIFNWWMQQMAERVLKLREGQPIRDSHVRQMLNILESNGVEIVEIKGKSEAKIEKAAM